MTLTIRERAQKVAHHLLKPGLNLRELAAAVGISKSAAHRHKQAIARRNRYPESSWWETEEGSAWLKRLVLGVVYYFGLKQGVGNQALSEFLKEMHLEGHVGCSPSCLNGLKQSMRDGICAYEAAQKEACVLPPGSGICVGGDETFFGLPILVMMELSSGYLLTEVEQPNRRYETWKAAIEGWWSQRGWKCRYMVSDAAKALIKLATDGLASVSVADLFHQLRALGNPIGRAIGRSKSKLNKEREALQAKLEKAPDEAKQAQLTQSLGSLGQKLDALEADQKTYHQALQSLSLQIHPFELETQQWRMASELPGALAPELEKLSTLAQTYGTEKAHQAIATFTKQIPDLGIGLSAWWQWVHEALNAQTNSPEVKAWVLHSLLPWAYWQQQADKTRHPTLKAAYRQATEQAQAKLLAAAIPQQMDALQGQKWLVWAQDMASKYQRTSSAVEGRNGYLSRLHHSSRGFSPQSLQVLTIIHNFDLKRADGTTAAQRLFGQPFPDLFEWVLEQSSELPLPRQSHKSQQPQPLLALTFPA